MINLGLTSKLDNLYYLVNFFLVVSWMTIGLVNWQTSFDIYFYKFTKYFLLSSSDIKAENWCNILKIIIISSETSGKLRFLSNFKMFLKLFLWFKVSKIVSLENLNYCENSANSHFAIFLTHCWKVTSLDNTAFDIFFRNQIFLIAVIFIWNRKKFILDF